MDTPTFWLVHVGTAVAGLVGFVAFRAAIGKRFDGAMEA
jgi:hypothetical protein